MYQSVIFPSLFDNAVNMQSSLGVPDLILAVNGRKTALEGRHERTQEAEEWCQSESFPKARIQPVTSRRNHGHS